MDSQRGYINFACEDLANELPQISNVDESLPPGFFHPRSLISDLSNETGQIPPCLELLSPSCNLAYETLTQAPILCSAQIRPVDSGKRCLPASTSMLRHDQEGMQTSVSVGVHDAYKQLDTGLREHAQDFVPACTPAQGGVAQAPVVFSAHISQRGMSPNTEFEQQRRQAFSFSNGVMQELPVNLGDLQALWPSPPRETVIAKRKVTPKKKTARASRFCHLCSRTQHRLRIACANVRNGTCRKAVCYACFMEHPEWDWDAANKPENEWKCPHCMNICSSIPKARCAIYKRVNARRRSARIQQQEQQYRQDQLRAKATSGAQVIASQNHTTLDGKGVTYLQLTSLHGSEPPRASTHFVMDQEQAEYGAPSGTHMDLRSKALYPVYGYGL